MIPVVIAMVFVIVYLYYKDKGEREVNKIIDEWEAELRRQEDE